MKIATIIRVVLDLLEMYHFKKNENMIVWVFNNKNLTVNNYSKETCQKYTFYYFHYIFLKIISITWRVKSKKEKSAISSEPSSVTFMRR